MISRGMGDGNIRAIDPYLFLLSPLTSEVCSVQLSNSASHTYTHSLYEMMWLRLSLASQGASGTVGAPRGVAVINKSDGNAARPSVRLLSRSRRRNPFSSFSSPRGLSRSVAASASSSPQSSSSQSANSQREEREPEAEAAQKDVADSVPSTSSTSPSSSAASASASPPPSSSSSPSSEPRRTLEALDRAYYAEGAPLISDDAYDSLKARLLGSDEAGSGAKSKKKKSTSAAGAGSALLPAERAVGFPVSAAAKVRHPSPMLSLDSVNSRADLEAWGRKAELKLLRAREEEEEEEGEARGGERQRSSSSASSSSSSSSTSSSSWVVEPKMDGLALRLQYRKGKLALAATRESGKTSRRPCSEPSRSPPRPRTPPRTPRPTPTAAAAAATARASRSPCAPTGGTPTSAARCS